MKGKIFMNIWIFFFFVLPVFAQDIFLKITDRGRARLKMAVYDFHIDKRSEFSLDPALGENIPSIIRKDLNFSLFFDIIKKEEMPQVVVSDEEMVDFPSLAKMGIQTVVVGFLKGEMEKFEVEIFVESVVLRQRVFKRKYEAEAKYMRQLAHTISDDIVKFFTGEDGVSSTRIFFVSKRDGNKEIFACDYDGANLEKVINLNSITLFPSISPDNSKLIFSSFFDGQMKLYLYDMSERNLEVICGYPGMNGPAAFSPDGSKIAVVLSKDGDADIFVMDLKKKKLERLTTEKSIETSPCWSPSGNEIVFTSDRSGSPQIYVMGADGTNIRRITWIESTYNDQPVWSPRGDRIVFVARLRDQFDIVTIDITGENPMVLTSSGNNQNPYWSPDGYHIVFSSNRDGLYRLYTMSWYGTEIEPITSGGEDYSPVWSKRYNWRFEK